MKPNLSYNVHALRPTYVQAAMRVGGHLKFPRRFLDAQFIETLRDGSGAYRVVTKDDAGSSECIVVVSRGQGGRLTAREV